MTVAIQALTSILSHTSIPAIRVSSAQARGKAKNYAYWGTAEYALCLSRAGLPQARVVSGASSDRRSQDLAWKDAHRRAGEVHGVLCQAIGALSDVDAHSALIQLANYGYPEAQAYAATVIINNLATKKVA